jgi:hypothetical protein
MKRGIILMPAEKLEGTIVDDAGATQFAGALVFGDESPSLHNHRRRWASFAFVKAPSATDGFAFTRIASCVFVSHPRSCRAHECAARSRDGNHLKPGPQTIKLERGVKRSPGAITQISRHRPGPG